MDKPIRVYERRVAGCASEKFLTACGKDLLLSITTYICSRLHDAFGGAKHGTYIEGCAE